MSEGLREKIDKIIRGKCFNNLAANAVMSELSAVIEKAYSYDKLTEGLKVEEKSLNHLLYKDGDLDIPDLVKDRNGKVDLSVCKLCEKGESELITPCTGTGSRPLTDDEKVEWVGEACRRGGMKHYSNSDIILASGARVVRE